MKQNDIWIGEPGIMIDTINKTNYSLISDCSNMITFLAVEKPLNHVKFKIFSIFNTQVWLLILLSLILTSIFNTKFNMKKQYPILIFAI